MRDRHDQPEGVEPIAHSERPARRDSPSRRDVLRLLGLGAVAVPLGRFVSGCDEEAGERADSVESDSWSADTADPADLSADTGAAPDTQPAGDSQPDADTHQPSSWATGGTAAMTAAASYPDPFADGLAEETCPLTCQLTLGPCYTPSAPVRQDVSEGEPGIPLRLMLRVVEADGCTPVAGAETEIWYCNVEGLYSGRDQLNVPFCTSGDERAEAAYFARGRAISDANGVLTFDATFPGWYPGRAIHIHLLVRRSPFAGGTEVTEAAVVTQLFFPEDLTAEIFAEVDGYTQRGAPDTTLATDGVTRGVSDVSPFVVGTRQMVDGAMLAWKTIALSDTASCG